MAYLGASPKQRSFRQSPVFKCVGGELTIPLKVYGQDSMLILNGSILPYGVDWNLDPSTQYPVLVSAAVFDDEFQILDLAGFSFAEMLSRNGGSMLGAINEALTVTVAAATTVDIGAINSNTIIISGAGTINSFGIAPAGTRRQIRFTGGQVISHIAGGGNINLPGAADIVASSGDTLEVTSTSSGASWIGTTYTRLNGYPVSLASKPNLLINGMFDIWQRGATASLATSGSYYSADRWVTAQIAAAVNTSSTLTGFPLGFTEVPGNPLYYMRQQITSWTATGAESYWAFGQRVEGCGKSAGGKLTVSFYARANTAKPMAVSLNRVYGTGGSPSNADEVAEQIVNLTTNFAKYVVTFNVPSMSGKTLGTNANDYIAVYFIPYKSNSVTTFPLNTGNLGAVPIAGDSVDLARVKMEESDFATPYDIEPLSETLRKCLRYYERGTILLLGYGGAGNSMSATAPYKAVKAVVPTVSLANTGTVNTTGALNYGSTTNEMIVYAPISAAGAAQVTVTWTSNAEI